MKRFKNVSTVEKAFLRLVENIIFHSTQQYHFLVINIMRNQYQVCGEKNVMIKENDVFFFLSLIALLFIIIILFSI